MTALIVAAGQGTRLRDKGPCKPLIPILGTPLIERVIASARRAGIKNFTVVSGYRGEELREALDSFSIRESISIEHVINEDWERSNGVSVYKAQGFVSDPFILTMCDHLVDPTILQDLLALPLLPDTVTLGVDTNIENPLNDPDDVTRVKCVDGKIHRIGKILKDYNAIDTGVFLCTSIIFKALETSFSEGDESISGAINVLARWEKAFVYPIENRVWVDIDDPAAFSKTEQLIKTGKL